MVGSQVGEPDYDRRLGAYRTLEASWWEAASPQAAQLLVHRCLADLRNAEDLPLRHASAQALQQLVEACVKAPQGAMVAPADQGLVAEGTEEEQEGGAGDAASEQPAKTGSELSHHCAGSGLTCWVVSQLSQVAAMT